MNQRGIAIFRRIGVKKYETVYESGDLEGAVKELKKLHQTKPDDYYVLVSAWDCRGNLP
jgi:hypothetical protein